MKIEHEPFKLFKTKYFVETGTYLGEGIKDALECNYPEIYSIEIKPELYWQQVSTFHSLINVNIIFGDSAYILYDLIKDFNEQITFWLDGHYSEGITGKGPYLCPLIRELNQIKKHHIKTHNIIIDDWRLWDDWQTWRVSHNEILQIINEINPDYKIRFMPHITERDILIANV